jgi:hypothetical protein
MKAACLAVTSVDFHTLHDIPGNRVVYEVKFVSGMASMFFELILHYIFITMSQYYILARDIL